VSEPGPGEFARYCLACSHQLAETGNPVCPECGTPFDPRDDRTYAGSAESSTARRRRGRWAAISAWAAGVCAGVVVVWSFLGMGRDLALLIGIATLPLQLQTLVMLALPGIPIRRRTRVAGLLALLAFVLTIHTDWPFRLAFALRRSALEAHAATVLDGTRPARELDRWIGGLHFRAVTLRDERVGFQLTGDDGGGEFLVFIDPNRLENPAWIWHNPNWEQNLGGGWYRVYED